MSKQIEKQKVGRPSVITEDSVRKLEAALAYGLGVNAACYYSGVSRSVYYEHKALDKEFSDKMRMAEEFATLKARQVIINAINEGNIKVSMWYLEHKARAEFAPPKAY
jgi:hypothetical protein